MPDTKSTDPQINLTFASLPLSFTGSQMQSLTAYDLNPTADLADIQQDVTYLAGTQQSNLVFGLTALQDLPDEAQAQKLGLELYKQANLGPEDDPNTG